MLSNKDCSADGGTASSLALKIPLFQIIPFRNVTLEARRLYYSRSELPLTPFLNIWGNQREGNLLEDPDVDRRIILR